MTHFPIFQLSSPPSSPSSSSTVVHKAHSFNNGPLHKFHHHHRTNDDNNQQHHPVHIIIIVASDISLLVLVLLLLLRQPLPPRHLSPRPLRQHPPLRRPHPRRHSPPRLVLDLVRRAVPWWRHHLLLSPSDVSVILSRALIPPHSRRQLYARQPLTHRRPSQPLSLRLSACSRTAVSPLVVRESRPPSSSPATLLSLWRRPCASGSWWARYSSRWTLRLRPRVH